VNRDGVIAISEACTGRDGAARCDLTLMLLETALARLALAASGAGPAPVSDAEAALAARLAATPGQARIWAALGSGDRCARGRCPRGQP
jgi:DNA polymerase III subunit delta'